FYGKYYLFVESWNAGLGWLVVIAAINSVISLFYYFRVAKALFLHEPAESRAAPQPVFVGFLVLLGVSTVGLFFYAAPLLGCAQDRARVGHVAGHADADGAAQALDLVGRVGADDREAGARELLADDGEDLLEEEAARVGVRVVVHDPGEDDVPGPGLLARRPE